MKHSIARTLLLGFFALILACPPAYAAKQVATVVATRGDVQAFDAKGKSRPLAIQTPIFEEDSIKTGEHSQVQIMFSDNTLINLGNATTMKIAEYRWQPEQKDGALKTQVKEGTFRVMGGALTKTAPQNFKTETPTATIGIRGSMYAGFVTPDFLSVVFQGGKGIEVTNAFGTVEITKPGFGTKVALTKPPLPPMKFTAQEIGEMNKSLSGNGAGGKDDKKEEQKDKGPAPKGEQGVMAAPAPADTAALGGGGGSTTTLGPPVTLDLKDIKDIGKDKIQKDIDITTKEIADTTTVTNTSLTGNYRIFKRDNVYDTVLQYYYSTFLAWDSGAVNATLSTAPSGTGTLAASFLSNGAYAIEYDSSPVSLSPFLTSFFAPYSYPGYAPTASSYTGFTSFTDTFSYNDSIAGLLTMTATNYIEPTGQFFYSTISFSAPDFLIGGLVYAGVPSGSIPAAGIDSFTGHLIYTSPNSLNIDADMEETRTTVNYNNKRLIGRSSDNNFQDINGKGAVFFGTMAANGTANVTILGGGDSNFNGGGGNEPTSAYGSAAATLYGSFHQGLAFTASGADYSVIDNTQTGTWEAIGAALRSPTRNTTPDPSSPITYTGFFIGVGDNTSTGAANRIYANSAASDINLIVNPTTGILSGTIANLNDLYNGGASRDLTIGGNQANSAYVANNDMVAILTGAGLKDHGNFLVTAGPDAPTITSSANDFMTWGYWEIAYTDASTSNDHLFGQQSFFVIGQQTPAAYLDSILNTASFTGTYDGKAFGVQLSSDGLTTSQLTNGATHLAVNFQNTTVANAVTGTISFDQASLAINSAANSLNNTGFHAYVSSVSGTTPLGGSQVNGAFYGLTAQGVGGNFHAQMDNGVRYLGVFGGNR